jgi:hypothetical protein
MSKNKYKKVQLKELTNLKMIAGNEKKYSCVIINGILNDWVGFGWVEVRKATKKDLQKFPIAINNK